MNFKRQMFVIIMRASFLDGEIHGMESLAKNVSSLFSSAAASEVDARAVAYKQHLQAIWEVAIDCDKERQDLVSGQLRARMQWQFYRFCELYQQCNSFPEAKKQFEAELYIGRKYEEDENYKKIKFIFSNIIIDKDV